MKYLYNHWHFLVFVLALASLVALGIWWTVYFCRAVALEKQYAWDSLKHQATNRALILGHQPTRPAIGPISHQLAIFPSSPKSGSSKYNWKLHPLHPDLAIYILDEAEKEIENRAKRRKWMYQGESAFLFLLISICIFMLFHYVHAEKQHNLKIRRFLSIITHEMKTPLTGIRSLLQSFAAGNIPAQEANKYWIMGCKEAERLEHLIDNALLSGQLRENCYSLQMESLHLHSFLQKFVEHRRQFLPDQPQAIALLWEPLKPDLEIVADKKALSVVLENLVDNALKFCPDPSKIRIRVWQSSAGLEVSVEDQGIGFSSDQAAVLFDPYSRPAQENASWSQGTGLGLTISQALMERMGYKIRAFSLGKGLGSTFVLTFREVVHESPSFTS